MPRLSITIQGRPIFTAESRIVIGARTGCTFVLDDALVGDRHCEITVEPSFAIRDLGSVSGTWLDGEPVTGAADLRDGAEIVIGSTRLRARITSGANGPELALELARQQFWFHKPGKRAFENDPDAWVRSELRFGRYPALRWLNRVAVLVALVGVVAGLVSTTALAWLSAPGALHGGHRALFASTARTDEVASEAQRRHALAAEQGCEACHTPGQGITATGCRACHTDMQKGPGARHPFFETTSGTAPATSTPFTADDCTYCHTDHGGTGPLKPGRQELVGKCAACHGTQPTPPPLAETWRESPIAALRFPHGIHLERSIDCVVCHHREPSGSGGQAASSPATDQGDFPPVSFATCKACHVVGAEPLAAASQHGEAWQPKEHVWDVRWHGSAEADGHCAACHAPQQRDGQVRFGPDLLPVSRTATSPEEYAATRARYTVTRRSHEAEFTEHAKGRTCRECHRSSVPATTATSTFWHELHLPTGAIDMPSARSPISRDAKNGCLSCHQDLASGPQGPTATPGGNRGADPSTCTRCHQPTSPDGPSPLVAVAPAPASSFPHGPHVTSASFGTSGPLAGGCFACHDFAAVGSGRRVPTTTPEASSCKPCHADHAHVAGNACQACHPDTRTDQSLWNIFLQAAQLPAGAPLGELRVGRPSARRWPAGAGFRHTSPGHDRASQRCLDCHDEAAMRKSRDLTDFPIPSEAQTATCRSCHQQQRFHFR